jgi:membrane protein
MNSIKRLFRFWGDFGKSLSENSVEAYSAQAAFFTITSFFPFMLLTVTLFQHLPFDTDFAKALPNSFISDHSQLLSSLLQEISEKAAPAVFLGTAAGISALWAASRCIMSIIQGLNKIYAREPRRGWLKLNLISIGYVFVFQLMLMISLGILGFGEQINKLLMLNKAVVNMRWVIGFAVLTFFFLFIYVAVPEKSEDEIGKVNKVRKTARIRQNFPGAVISAAGWVAFTGLFSLYIDNFADLGLIYGSLTAAVVVMLWLYFCMLIMFAGAMFNVVLNRKSP